MLRPDGTGLYDGKYDPDDILYRKVLESSEKMRRWVADHLGIVPADQFSLGQEINLNADYFVPVPMPDRGLLP